MAKIPETKAQERRTYGALTASERRAVARAVNRGKAVDKRKHAPLAVVLARRQMKLWRRAWLLGLVVGAVGFTDGWQVALVNGVIGMAMLGLVARYWFVRARRAETANLAIVERSSPKAKRSGARSTSPAKADVSPAGRWLPRRRARE